MKFRYRILLKNSTVTGQALIDAAKAVLRTDQFHSEISVRTDNADLLAVGLADPASDDFVIAVGTEFLPEIDPKGSYSVINICSYKFERGHDWINHKPVQRNDSERGEIAEYFRDEMQKYLNGMSSD